MAQQPVELILLKQWAGLVSSPVWITDVAGNLVYYNEPAESILGHRFEEQGELNADDLAEFFMTSNLDGSPIPNNELPLVVALSQHVPGHREMRIRDAAGEWRHIEVTALPVEGPGDRHLGAMAVFWEVGGD